MKSHEELRSLLPAMAGGDLSKMDQARLELHLAECPTCRSELAQLQAVVKAMRSTPELEPPPWLATRIMARVKEEQESHRSWFARLFLPLQIKLPLEALALVMICATTWYVMQDVNRSQQRTSAPPAAEAPAAAPVREADRLSEDQIPRATVPVTSPSKPVASKAVSAPSAAPARPDAQRSQAAPTFAPQPQQVPAPVEQMERSKSASESVPAPSVASREKRVASPSPLPDRTVAAKRKAESSDSAAGVTGIQPQRLRLVVDDGAKVSDTLGDVVQRLGGTILERRTGSARVRIQMDRLPELMEQLSRLGRIAERPVADKAGDKILELQILWQVENK
ncbi:MAG: DUF2275 domain-containing protein [Trichlorobacter sp.]|uniref:DUF2275 domain-containing protein n=1 Tax=Trichlorobacter sp. TaxID=2911007 RepID=UPI002563C2F7|nr:DUF2275 domain-containing protein [Trichlorobacter sp.]MDK9718325.1 DUF2275 domain-containing protein [Trichlorobacter sp.]